MKCEHKGEEVAKGTNVFRCLKPLGDCDIQTHYGNSAFHVEKKEEKK